MTLPFDIFLKKIDSEINVLKMCVYNFFAYFIFLFLFIFRKMFLNI